MSDSNIRATCPDCGDVVVSRDDVVVRVCADDKSGSYCLRCPICGNGFNKPCEERIVQLLVAGGVRMIVWHLPAELKEQHYGAPIEYDDILEFHEAVEDEDLLAELASVE